MQQLGTKAAPSSQHLLAAGDEVVQQQQQHQEHQQQQQQQQQQQEQQQQQQGLPGNQTHQSHGTSNSASAKVSPAVAAALSDALNSIINPFKLVALLQTLHSSGYHPSQHQMHHLLQSVEPCLSMTPLRQLQQLLALLGKLCYRPSHSWLISWEHATALQLQQPAVQLQEPVLQLEDSALQRQQYDLTMQVELLVAVAGVHQQPSPTWVASWIAAVEKLLPSASLGELVHMLQCIVDYQLLQLLPSPRLLQQLWGSYCHAVLVQYRSAVHVQRESGYLLQLLQLLGQIRLPLPRELASELSHAVEVAAAAVAGCGGSVGSEDLGSRTYAPSGVQRTEQLQYTVQQQQQQPERGRQQQQQPERQQKVGPRQQQEEQGRQQQQDLGRRQQQLAGSKGVTSKAGAAQSRGSSSPVLGSQQEQQQQQQKQQRYHCHAASAPEVIRAVEALHALGIALPVCAGREVVGMLWTCREQMEVKLLLQMLRLLAPMAQQLLQTEQSSGSREEFRSSSSSSSSREEYQSNNSSSSSSGSLPRPGLGTSGTSSRSGSRSSSQTPGSSTFGSLPSAGLGSSSHQVSEAVVAGPEEALCVTAGDQLTQLLLYAVDMVGKHYEGRVAAASIDEGLQHGAYYSYDMSESGGGFEGYEEAAGGGLGVVGVASSAGPGSGTDGDQRDEVGGFMGQFGSDKGLLGGQLLQHLVPQQQQERYTDCFGRQRAKPVDIGLLLQLQQVVALLPWPIAKAALGQLYKLSRQYGRHCPLGQAVQLLHLWRQRGTPQHRLGGVGKVFGRLGREPLGVLNDAELVTAVEVAAWMPRYKAVGEALEAEVLLRLELGVGSSGRGYRRQQGREEGEEHGWGKLQHQQHGEQQQPKQQGREEEEEQGWVNQQHQQQQQWKQAFQLEQWGKLPSIGASVPGGFNASEKVRLCAALPSLASQLSPVLVVSVVQAVLHVVETLHPQDLWKVHRALEQLGGRWNSIAAAATARHMAVGAASRGSRSLSSSSSGGRVGLDVQAHAGRSTNIIIISSSRAAQQQEESIGQQAAARSSGHSLLCRRRRPVNREQLGVAVQQEEEEEPTVQQASARVSGHSLLPKPQRPVSREQPGVTAQHQHQQQPKVLAATQLLPLLLVRVSQLLNSAPVELLPLEGGPVSKYVALRLLLGQEQKILELLEQEYHGSGQEQHSNVAQQQQQQQQHQEHLQQQQQHVRRQGQLRSVGQQANSTAQATQQQQQRQQPPEVSATVATEVMCYLGRAHALLKGDHCSPETLTSICCSIIRIFSVPRYIRASRAHKALRSAVDELRTQLEAAAWAEVHGGLQPLQLLLLLRAHAHLHGSSKGGYSEMLRRSCWEGLVGLSGRQLGICLNLLQKEGLPGRFRRWEELMLRLLIVRVKGMGPGEALPCLEAMVKLGFKPAPGALALVLRPWFEVGEGQLGGVQSSSSSSVSSSQRNAEELRDNRASGGGLEGGAEHVEASEGPAPAAAAGVGVAAAAAVVAAAAEPAMAATGPPAAPAAVAVAAPAAAAVHKLSPRQHLQLLSLLVKLRAHLPHRWRLQLLRAQVVAMVNMSGVQLLRLGLLTVDLGSYPRLLGGAWMKQWLRLVRCRLPELSKEQVAQLAMVLAGMDLLPCKSTLHLEDRQALVEALGSRGDWRPAFRAGLQLRFRRSAQALADVRLQLQQLRQGTESPATATGIRLGASRGKQCAIAYEPDTVEDHQRRWQLERRCVFWTAVSIGLQHSRVHPELIRACLVYLQSHAMQLNAHVVWQLLHAAADVASASSAAAGAASGVGERAILAGGGGAAAVSTVVGQVMEQSPSPAAAAAGTAGERVLGVADATDSAACQSLVGGQPPSAYPAASGGGSSGRLVAAELSTGMLSPILLRPYVRRLLRTLAWVHGHKVTQLLGAVVAVQRAAVQFASAAELPQTRVAARSAAPPKRLSAPAVSGTFFSYAPSPRQREELLGLLLQKLPCMSSSSLRQLRPLLLEVVGFQPPGPHWLQQAAAAAASGVMSLTAEQSIVSPLRERQQGKPEWWEGSVWSGTGGHRAVIREMHAARNSSSSSNSSSRSNTSNISSSSSSNNSSNISSSSSSCERRGTGATCRSPQELLGVLWFVMSCHAEAARQLHRLEHRQSLAHKRSSSSNARRRRPVTARPGQMSSVPAVGLRLLEGIAVAVEHWPAQQQQQKQRPAWQQQRRQQQQAAAKGRSHAGVTSSLLLGLAALFYTASPPSGFCRSVTLRARIRPGGDKESLPPCSEGVAVQPIDAVGYTASVRMLISCCLVHLVLCSKLGLVPQQLVQQLHVRDVQQQLQTLAKAVLQKAANKKRQQLEVRERREQKQRGKQLVVDALHKAMTQAAAATAAEGGLRYKRKRYRMQQEARQQQQQLKQQQQRMQAQEGTVSVSQGEVEGMAAARVVVVQPLAVKSLSLQLTGLLRWAFIKAQGTARPQSAPQQEEQQGEKVKEEDFVEPGEEKGGMKFLWMQGLGLPAGGGADSVHLEGAERGPAGGRGKGGRVGEWGGEGGQGREGERGKEGARWRAWDSMTEGDAVDESGSSPAVEQRTIYHGVQPLMFKALELRFTGLLRGLALSEKPGRAS